MTVSRADRAEGSAPIPHPPSIDRMAGWPALAPLIGRAGRPLVIEALRAWADAKRGTAEVDEKLVPAGERPGWPVSSSRALRRVFNLTGTVLHTNLGRALLPEAAIAAAVEAMRSPVRWSSTSRRRRAASETITCAASFASSPARKTRRSSTTTPPRCCWC